MYERDTKKCLFVVVPSRDAFTLLNIIYKHVKASSTIYSDCWKSYNRLKQLDKSFEHMTVNHDICFKDKSTGVHTNGIESVWNSAKSHMKTMRGVSRTYLQSYLDEFSWRHNNSSSRFECFEQMLHAIARQHSPSNPPGDFLDEQIEAIQGLKLEDVEEDLFSVIEPLDNEKIPELPDYPESNECPVVSNECPVVSNESGECTKAIESPNLSPIATPILRRRTLTAIELHGLTNMPLHTHENVRAILQPPPKRGRGRPKGSKNKPKEKSGEEEQTGLLLRSRGRGKSN